MEQWRTRGFSQSNMAPDSSSTPSACFLPQRLVPSNWTDSRQRSDMEVAKDPTVARKVQKADREKLRRDRLNEQFLELGNTLDADPGRPKNDKATILTDTIQMLKDSTTEVNRLKAEYATLTEESRELTQEKNELKEEKASLKSDIENLNVQYQRRMRVMYPWAAIDPSLVMGPPYSYPLPIPMHPSRHPFPFFGNQNPGPIPNPCSTFVPYTNVGLANHPIKQPSSQHASASKLSGKHDPKSKPLDRNEERCDESADVATDLELKMPGSSALQELSCGGKGKGSLESRKITVMANSSSRYSSSSQVVQECSSNSVGDIPKASN